MSLCRFLYKSISYFGFCFQIKNGAIDRKKTFLSDTYRGGLIVVGFIFNFFNKLYFLKLYNFLKKVFKMNTIYISLTNENLN